MEKKLIIISPAKYAEKMNITRQMACYLLRKNEVGKGELPNDVEKAERMGTRWLLHVNPEMLKKS